MSTPNSSSSSSPIDKSLPERKGKEMWEDEESKDDEDTTGIPSLGSRRKKPVPLVWEKIQTLPAGPRVIGGTPHCPEVIPKGYHFDVFEGVRLMICFRCGMRFDHLYNNCPKDEDSPEVVKFLENFPKPQGTLTKLKNDTQIISPTINEEELSIDLRQS